MLRKSAAAALVLMLFAPLAGDALHAADAGAILSKIAGDAQAATQAIEDAKGSMNAFYAALSRTAAGQPGAVTRIAHYGDSLIEMDLLSGEARRRLQSAFGDAGHGFIHVAKTRTWYHHDDVEHDPEAKWIAFQLKERGFPLNRFGLGGAVSVPYKAGAESEIGTVRRGDVGKSVSRFEILALRSPDGGGVDVELDGKELGSFTTKAGAVGDGVAVVKTNAGEHELTLTAKDTGAKLYGVVMENDGPGVVYDALGVNGIGANALLRSDKDHWRAQLAHRAPNLVILNFGTNEATEPKLDIAFFKIGLKQVIDEIRKALPSSSILIMAPLDRAEKRGADLATMPNIPKIVAAERELAQETGIAFWNTFEAMGGDGSMAKWYHQKPRLASGDFMHPTREGADVLGKMWYQAIAAGLSDYLKKNGVAAAAPKMPDDPIPVIQEF